MFIYTVKASTVKFFTVLFLSAAALVALIAIMPVYDYEGDIAIVETNYGNVYTNENRLDFINGFGYDVNEAYEFESIVIPEDFDAVYEVYNDMQRAQGLNLKRYRGKTVNRYTYYVTNYDDYEGKVVLTLLVYKDKIIGGDVTGLGNEGFAHGFDRNL